jgi:dCMP deaminase
MPSHDQWNKLFIKMAFNIAEMSKDPSTKVGAVIVSMDNKQCSYGYNGMAAGVEETDDEWSDRSKKYELVIHAEENAILNCPFSLHNTKIYITHKPCHKCLIRLKQAGIKQVYYANDYIKMGHADIWDKYSKYFDIIAQI